MEKGIILFDKYTYISTLGVGGTSRVFLCKDLSIGKLWAIKKIKKRPETLSSINEAYILKDLDHPMLPRVVEIFDTNDSYYIVMDYIDGVSLKKLSDSKKINEKLLLKIAVSLCEVLSYLHNRKNPILHKDIKPSNIMITKEGNLKLIDFGISNDVIISGTKGFAAPEQYIKDTTLDERTDIFCLGKTLLYMSKNIKHISFEISEIISKCTKKDPNKRFQNISELLYAIQNIKEYDKAFLVIQKKRFHIFIFTFFIFVLSICSCLVSIIATSKTIEKDFYKNIELAKLSNIEDEANDYYKNIFNTCPERIEGYFSFIEKIKEDECFSVKEEEILSKNIGKNLDSLEKEKEFKDLCFKIGNLYWYYYDYGSNDDFYTGIKNSFPWFEKCIELFPKDSKEYKLSSVCYRISAFNKQINQDILEKKDAGNYKKYMQSILELVDISYSSEDLFISQVIELGIGAINTYSYKFYLDNIPYDDIKNLHTKVSNLTIYLKQISSDTDINPLLEKLNYSNNLISSVYNRR